MSKYNWDERHIITFPEEKVVLSTKDLHVYYGTNLQDLGNQPTSVV